MSDHEAKQERDEMAEEDSVKTEEKQENDKEDVKEEEEEMEQEEEKAEEEEEEEEESKETEPEKEEKEEEEESKEVNEVKEEEKPPKEKKQKPKKEEIPAKEAPSTPRKETDVPLYDQPLEMSGKRDRKKVERFVQETKKEELNVTGNGVALGDIPFVESMITKMGNDELKILHRVAYSRPGSGNEIKKNLRKFNGFPYSKDDKKYQYKTAMVERIVMSELKKILKILGLERSGKKDEVVERLMAFMLHPEDCGKKPLKIKKAKARGRPSKKSLEKKQNNTSQDDSVSSRSDSNQSASEQEDDEEDEEEVEEKPKKTPGRKPAGKKTPGKRTPAAKRTPATKRAKPAPASDDSDSDDEPLAKKVKQPPSDAELKVMVKKILEGANLEEVTMKSVCRQVYDSYPDFDLTHKKVFIKETVKSIIS